MARDRPMQFERHMSDNEALMWNLEKDPALSSWFASITVLDQVPSIDRLRARLDVAVREIPRLRQRVVPSVGRMSPPMWADDPQFDLDYHIRRMAVPAPGGDRQLYDLASALLLDPFERTRPLWQFVVIEGLSGGRGVIFQKMHHTITDGEGGVRLAEKFVDLERDVADPVASVTPFPDPPIEDFGESAREVVGHNLRRLGGVAERVTRSVVTNPVGTIGGVGQVVGELRKALFPSSDPASRVGSPLWTERSLKRWYGTIQVPFDQARGAAKALGGSVNDFFVAGALAGAGAYHRDHGAVPNALRVAMPVSTRRGGTAGGNNFSLTTTDLAAPSEVEMAFSVVRDGLASAKSGNSVDILGSLSMIINLLPTSVVAGFAKDTAATVDFTVSNVRGAPIDIFMAGAKVEAVFPMGPISGTGFNLTMLSYNGSMDMGMVVDAGAIAHPEDLRDDIAAAYDALIAAGSR
nr:putative wax ester synthase/acyl-CoA:diacylglycerol acyltransferase [uncultured bacterium]